MIEPFPSTAETEPDEIDHLAAELRDKVARLEKSGRAASAAALLVRTLGAKQVLRGPDGDVTVDHYRLQMAAVLVLGEILDPLPTPKEAA